MGSGGPSGPRQSGKQGPSGPRQSGKQGPNIGGLTMPTTVVLDAKGTVVSVHAGSLDTAGLTNLIADKLGVT